MYVDFLKAFLDTTQSFSHVYKPTSPCFIANVIPITQLFHKYHRKDSHIRFLPQMETKWLKYWTDIPIVYVFALILDPRWKFDGTISLVNGYKHLMGLPFDKDEYTNEIRSKFFSVFNHYESIFGNTNRHSSSSSVFPSSSSGYGDYHQGAGWDQLTQLASQFQAAPTTTTNLTEFHMYMSYNYTRGMTPDECNNLDLCNWWKGSARSLPVLTAMARDFLAIQVSSVASESCFSMAKRVLDEKRNRMTSDTLRLCVLYKDWLDADDRKQGTISPDSDEDSDEQTSTESVE
jgi:hypothetical protein